MTPAPDRNVLFVVMDTVRKDHLTPYGYERPTTPALESFAEEATVYEQAVSPAPWTLPVHASMFTGRYPSEHGASQEQPYLDESVGTLAEAMRAAGYDTACYSSNAWITPYTRLTAGFDEQDNFFEVMPGEFLSGTLADLWQKVNDNDRMRAIANRLVELGNDVHEYFAGAEGADSKTPEVIDNTVAFTEEADEWFAFVNLMDAHLPVYPPEEYREEFAPGVDPDEVCQNSKEYNSGARDISEGEFDDIRGLYDAEIRHIDAELERLFDHLKATDQWEDTLVVVCADHGELHGEHGLYGHEFGIYDPLVNVPLLVKAPGTEPSRSDVQVEMQDLYHTVLDFAGVEATETGEPVDTARSLLSADYRDFADGEYAFVEYHRPVVELKQLETKAAEAGIDLDEDSRFYSRMRAARRPDGKYVRNERIDDEAYRLDRDPDETENLAGADDEVLAEVEATLREFEARVGETWDDDYDPDADVLGDMDGATKDRLQDLGYLE
ncbi:sulfatase [Halosegnis marinus]|uniref:Sulfatase n=1 Tax=Halosegnis marinus TaxID=3034023 RepID=A0ABD5ZNR0_9EURY|nr:sulfatase [Halosegnis sp. DT85]